MPVEIVPMVFALAVVAACWQPPVRRKRVRAGLTAIRRGLTARTEHPEIRRRFAAGVSTRHRGPHPEHDEAPVAVRQRERRPAGFVTAGCGRHAAFAPSRLPPVGFSPAHPAEPVNIANAAGPRSDLELLQHVLVGEAAQAELDRRRSVAEAGAPKARSQYVRATRRGTMTG